MRVLWPKSDLEGVRDSGEGTDRIALRLPSEPRELQALVSVQTTAGGQPWQVSCSPNTQRCAREALGICERVVGKGGKSKHTRIQALHHCPTAHPHHSGANFARLAAQFPLSIPCAREYTPITVEELKRCQHLLVSDTTQLPEPRGGRGCHKGCRGVSAQRAHDGKNKGVLLQLAISLPTQTVLHPHNVGQPHVSPHPHPSKPPKAPNCNLNTSTALGPTSTRYPCPSTNLPPPTSLFCEYAF